MKLRNLITIAAVALLAIAANAATIVVPAAGTGPGANESTWQSELTLHTAGPRAVTLSVEYHQGMSVFGPVEVTLQARETLSIADVVRTRFGVEAGSGAIVINVADRDAKSVAVTSRTTNVSAIGELGQDVAATDTANALRPGDIAALPGPSSVAVNRFNFGIYAVEGSDVTWRVVRANGTIAASKDVAYAAGEHAQYNSGIATLLGVEAMANDTVHAVVTSGRAVFYGSIINALGDPTFVPGVRTRADIAIHFAGVDIDEDGTVDIADSNGDGVLDAAIQIPTSLYPVHFRVVATGEFGELVDFEIVSTPAPADLLNGRVVRVAAGGDVKGKSGTIVIRATSDGSAQLLTIPVLFM